MGKSVLASLATLLASFLFCLGVNGQYYMYTPGAPWPASIEPLDMFGGMIDYCNCSYCPYPEYPTATACVIAPGFDETLCQELDNATRTPYIDTTHRYGLANETGAIRISCSLFYASVIDNILMVYTTDGTLPDVKKANLLSDTDVPYDATNPSPRIAVRCQAPGRAWSRIAYMTRVVFDTATNGTWCSVFNGDVHYKEMPLPLCDWGLYGSACDGQTIIANASPPASPTPSSAPTPSASTPHTPSLPSSASSPSPSSSSTGSGTVVFFATFLLALGLPLCMH